MTSVLFVDPDPSIQGRARVHLEGADMDVTSARSTLEAESLMSGRRFDAIVCDCRRPGMQAVLLLKKLRGAGDDIPFIIFSEAEAEGTAARAVALGADFFVQKEESLRTDFTDLVRMIQDSVALRMARGALGEALNQFHVISESVPSLMVMVDRDGVIKDCNRRMAETLGCSASSITGRLVGEFVEKTGCQDSDVSPLESCLRSKVVDMECRLVRRDGDRLDVLLSSAPFADPSGDVVGSIIVLSDVTDARRAAAAMQVLERRYRLLEEHISDCISGKDPEFKYSDLDKGS